MTPPSQDTHIRHFFRHLDDASALRGNPFARKFFDGDPLDELSALAAVRDAIRRHVASFFRFDVTAGHAERGKRHHAIVTRCDLHGEPHVPVARDLGLSRSQFYRERRIACRRVANAILAEVHQQVAACSADLSELALAQATTLWQFGRVDAAVGIALGVADSLIDADRRVEALCSAAQFCADANDLTRAGDLVARASALARATEGGDDAAPAIAWARVKLVRAMLAVLRGNAGGYHAEIQEALDLLRPQSPAMTRSSRELLGRVLLERCSQLVGDGHFAAARELQQEADTLIAALQPCAVDAIDLALASAEVAAGTGSANDATASRLRAALDLAKKNGLLRATVAILAMTIGTPTLGETPETASRALAAAQRYGNPRLLAEVHCIVACTKVGRSDPASIAQHLRAASAGMAKGTPLWINGKLVESQLAVTRGDVSHALAVLNEVRGFVNPRNAPRLQGSVLRQLAVVHYALGKVHDADDLIRESLTIHASHGSRSNYALTRRVADRLHLMDRRSAKRSAN